MFWQSTDLSIEFPMCSAHFTLLGCRLSVIEVRTSKAKERNSKNYVNNNNIENLESNFLDLTCPLHECHQSKEIESKVLRIK